MIDDAQIDDLVVILSNADAAAFAELIEKCPPPNDVLIEAFGRWQMQRWVEKFGGVE